MPVQTVRINTARIFLFLWSLCSIYSNAYGQYNYAKIPPFDITSGLPHNEVNDIAIDNEGYAWIATDNGVSRYDGYNFINFNSTTYPSLFKNNIVNEIAKNGNALYLLTEGDGLIEVNTQKIRFRKLSLDKPLSLAFSEDTTAFLFNTGELVLKRNNAVIFKKKIDVGVKASILIYQGDLIISADKGNVYRLDPNYPNERTSISIVNNWKSGKLHLSKTYGVINSNGWRVFILKGNEFLEHPEFVGKERVNFFLEEDSGEILRIDKFRVPVANVDGVTIAFELGEAENIQFKSIHRINKTTFLAGSNQGLVPIDQRPALSKRIMDYPLVEYNEPIVRRRIVEYKNSKFYLGFPYIVREDENGELAYFTKIPLSTYDGVIFNNRLFCTTEGSGLVSFDLKSKKPTTHVCNVLKVKDHLYDISIFSDTTLLVAGDNKIATYNPSTNKGVSLFLQPGTSIYVAVQKKNSNIIFLGTSKGIIRVKLDKQKGFELLDPETDLGFDARDIHIRENSNEIWVASSKGVLVLNLNDLKYVRQYNTELTVSHPKVTALIEDNNQCIWASTYSGITVYNMLDGTIRFLDNSQGIINHEFNYKSATLLQNGQIAFGGLNAFEIIDPNQLNKFQYKNSFLISGIETVGINKTKWLSSYIKDVPIEFQTGKESIKIYLANLDFQFGSGYKFQYSLDSKNWFNTDDKKWILLSDLSYGEYSLKIRMFDPYGKLVEEKTIEVSALAPFYVKTEFHIFLIVIGLLTIAVIAYSLLRAVRIRAVTKAKIAMDLHDESGTILTRLLLISKKSKFEAKERELIQNGLKEALYSFRTYLDSISTKNHSLRDLSDDLKEFITSACADGGIQFKFKMDFEKNYRINRELYRDVKLSVYEIVSNCLKHSQASSITVECKSENKLLTLIISDNGTCDLSLLGTQKGNGIRNIRNRANRNNGFVRHYVKEGETGLTTEIQLPIA
jgi:two-component sensor histidine kinase